MGRSPCCDEKHEVKKGPWTPEEDQILIKYIGKHGHGNWRALPKHAGLNRCGKSCRLRWTNYLRPDIKRGRFSDEEESTIINLHSVLGNKWSRIATHLPGRTDNEIKNFWNTSVRKKLLHMGIDPNTHKPRTDLNHFLNLSHLVNGAIWGNPLKLEAEVAQIAKIQLLQNLLQFLNTSTVPNMDNSNLQGPQNLMNPMQIGHEFSNNCMSMAYPMADCFEGGFGIGHNGNIMNNNLGSSFQVENQMLPPLVSSASPGNLNQTERDDQTNPNDCLMSASTNFESWDNFINDIDETSQSYWKDILESAL